MKNVFAALLLILSTPALALAACEKPYVFFDLGETLVDTDSNKYNPMFYYVPDAAKFRDAAEFPTAKKYIDKLVRNGHLLGIMADIPGDWGINYPANDPVRDLPTAKILRTIAFLAGEHAEDEASWRGEAMDWSPFVKIEGRGANRKASGRLILPQSNAERKKVGSLVVFERALAIANAAGCPAIFQGENDKEMVLAERAGMIPFWAGHTKAGFFYLPVEEISSYINGYRPGDWKGSN